MTPSPSTSSPTGNDHGVAKVVNHKDYYICSGDVKFLVENHLFRVQKYFFERESVFFRNMFAEESAGHEPYVLRDVTSDDFASLLWVFYNPRYSLYNAPIERWGSILNLANRWEFPEVKDLAVRELEKIKIDPVDKIALYTHHKIDHSFLIPSYAEISKRSGPPTLEQAHKLGMETLLRIHKARERALIMAAESGCRSPTTADADDSSMNLMIREVFGILGPSCNGTTNGTANGANHTTNGGSNGQSNGSHNGSTKLNGDTPLIKTPETKQQDKQEKGKDATKYKNK
ncbi:hypothetical protein SERLADRAFT_414470 [Serpula lacrymans var. lacrymans S7.9]|uniref:BTB domain-containing protein n=1 Tax=Serpula lacrymans var. lacrymans (strain S7.9) TaxID=578457 RepID=F8NSB8_SERL9|nr:uncharacterized protein SERLADRAFT_414470 [Serpula lacrymans var. lacrymans S7.9]EGO26427.1 hypothetical protein SERLADRAFT_414470 [Serpula lacrymans var. lacrymans S7.9]